MSKGITITVEYLPGVLNVVADYESRYVQDSSEWMLCPKTFNLICSVLGVPEIDLFASRISHQVPKYFAWKLDHYSVGRDAFQTKWTHLKGYAFPPFSLMGRVLRKVELDQATIVVVAPVWQGQPWFPKLLQLAVRNPILLPFRKDLLKNPKGEDHPLLVNSNLRLAADDPPLLDFSISPF